MDPLHLSLVVCRARTEVGDVLPKTWLDVNQDQTRKWTMDASFWHF